MTPSLMPSNVATQFASGNTGGGDQGPRRMERARSKSEKMQRAAERWAKASDLEIDLADPRGYLQYILMTGRDPLEQLINRTDGDESPFRVLLKRAVEVITGESIPNTTKAPQLVDKNGHPIYEALEERLKERGWVPIKQRMAIAKILLPFVHHRLASIEVSGMDGAPIKWQEAASKIAMTGPGIRGMMEGLARRAAADMGTQSDSHIIKDPKALDKG